MIEISSGVLTRVTSSPLEEFEPTWSPDSSQLAFVTGPGSAGARIEAINLSSGSRRTVEDAPSGARLNSPTWSPDGTRLAYTQFKDNRSLLVVSGTPVGANADVFPFYPCWLSSTQLLYTADGKIWVCDIGTGIGRTIPFQARLAVNRNYYRAKQIDFDSRQMHPVKGIVSPAIAPDGSRIVFEALNQLWVMKIGEEPQPITNDMFFKVDPSWAPDGVSIAYSSDKSGSEQIYVRNLATGTERQVTQTTGAAISPSWSPDGTKLAFLDQTGATYIVEVSTGKVGQVLGPQFAPGRPSWSGDGTTILLAALKQYTRRYREGTSQILSVNINSGSVTYTEPAPFKSLSTRGDDGPVVSPDGSLMAFVMDDVLWVMPVDPSGRPKGSPRQINHEPTDALSWSGDSRQLLYLSNGKLRLISRDGSNVRTIPMNLEWRREQPSGRTLIHAGRLWDGRGPASRTDVDLWVVDNRVAIIRSHSNQEHARASKEGSKLVDASHSTVIPGLWEGHTHHFVEGKSYGSRLGLLWLAYGVTSLQSFADPVYRAVETREAFAAGARRGPRFFATGEAIDGERIFYNTMRPTTSPEQLELSLSRAQALDYDMIKTYVRLPADLQDKVVRFAHERMGVGTVSHYMYPGVSFGQDGMAHVSATARTGFAYTRSAAGISYEDVIKTFQFLGSFLVSTTLNGSLYAEDPHGVEDERLMILNTPWDQRGLLQKRDDAVRNDQSLSLDSLRKEEATVAAIRDEGGTVLAGTDSPLDNVGTALHLNLRAQVKYGLKPWQALQSATMLTAKAFHKEKDLGTIEPGKLADMVFVDGNPLESIADAAKVQMVMINGRLYTVPELEEQFRKFR